MSLFSKIFGDPTAKELARITKKIVQPVNALEAEWQKLSDAELAGKTAEFRQALAAGQTTDDLIVPIFATVREAARRTLGQRHFDVQLIGGYTLYQGRIAEMKTGEGKTLTSTLAIYARALAGEGVHVVTVNDYLAKRDACWMGQIYHYLGLTVGINQNQGISFLYDPTNQSEQVVDRVLPATRQAAYAADITYGTNNEFGFDYLRDNMVVAATDRVQRKLEYAIVDEIDSILIDEARTPLIISAAAEESTNQYYQFAKLVQNLRENEHYNVDEKMRAATLTEAGINYLEKALGVENIYVEGGMLTVHHIEQALKAYVLFKRDRDYVVKDDEVIIVDEFTGRLMPGRRYSEGLHQAIEAKEGVAIQRESQTLATVTFQNYFRMYRVLAGMTGTAATEAEEFSKIYNLEVLVVPTNRAMVRRDLNDQIYKSEAGKFAAVAKQIQEFHAAGQPVLVGTISIEKNEELSELLTQAGIPHQVLNAKQHEREAEIIAQAGRRGAVTLATNMAGRGVDIILGGQPPADKTGAEYTAWQAEHEAVLALGGLAVIGTERHESRRIDNQLRGRSGRQGDPGLSRFFISLEDDLMRIFGPERIKGMMTALKIPADMPIENQLITRSIESAQKKVEGHNFDIRKHLVEYDDVINKQRETIYRKRRQALDQGDELKDMILNELVRAELSTLVQFHTAGEAASEWNFEELYETANSLFGVPTDARLNLEAIELRENKGRLHADEAREAMIGYLYELAVKKYNQVEQEVITATGRPTAMRDVEKGVVLRTIDTLWVEHLDAMDHLRRSIGLRGYGQRDPLIEYKKEAFGMFKQLLAMVQQQVSYSIFKVGVEGQQLTKSLLDRQGVSLAGAAKTATNNARGVNFGDVVSSQISAAMTPSHRDPAGNKIGRNDPCYCGSGKKYKNCHGA